jgi:threonyl-tRNA synthetase
MLEEAEKRDHRKMGRQLDLFHLQEEAPGMVFWHPRGWTHVAGPLSNTCAGLQEPAIKRCAARRFWTCRLWKKSGHWDNYQENMFTTESEKRTYAVKADELPGPRADFQLGLHSSYA